MATLEELRARLTPQQRQILQRLWDSEREPGGGVSARLLFHGLQMPDTRHVLESLGGSVVAETQGPLDESYVVTLLGALLTERGYEFELQLAEYGQYLVKEYGANPKIVEIVRDGVDHELHLSRAASIDLCRLVNLANLCSGGSWHSGGDWINLRVPHDIHDLTGIRDWRAFVREKALSGYDPELPVRAVARNNYRTRGNRTSSSSARAFSGRNWIAETAWRVWNDPVLSKVIATVIIAVGTYLIVTAGPCKEKRKEALNTETITPQVSDTAHVVVPSSRADMSGRGIRKKAENHGEGPAAMWSPPPYAILKIRGLRSHPVQFKLWGDSVIVDVTMEPGDSTVQRWPMNRPSRPFMKFEVYSPHIFFHPGKLDEWLEEGQWAVAEKDRAVFVVPKNRVMWKNLRLSPSVSVDSSTRYPLVEGKWMRKGDTRSWFFRLKIDGSGGVVKNGWENIDKAKAF